MSSLSKQLDSIRGVSVRTKATGRASILFHAREAEDIDAETIFGLATNAFTQLARGDARLQRFGPLLFSDKAKAFDRDLATKEENDAADAVVNAFLRAVSPYASLSAGQKALEWLIRRYR